MRRVFARAVSGVEFPATSVTKAERELAESLVPDEEPATWAVAVMELGALVCTAAARGARPARSTTGAPGTPPADRRTTDHRGADRPGPAPTVRSGDG